LLHLCFERLDLLRIRVRPFAPLLLQPVVTFLNRGQRLIFLRPVLRSDGLRAFESHMLEHMRQTGLSLRIVHRAGVHVGVEGNHGRLVTLQNDEMHSVRERELGDAFLEFLQILRHGKTRRKQ